MNFGKNILNYKDDILRDLDTLVKIRSVSANDKENCQKALDFVLERAEQMGFAVKNVGGFAGHIQLGNTGRLGAVVTHLDVVDAGENWTYPPFELTRKNGRIYGRGVADDKGAAIVSLYCLKALKDFGVEGENTLRAIFGTSEEIGMEDLEHYFESEQRPDISFTPDSSYGICRSEKGILQLEIYSERHDGTVLTEFCAGNAINAVPDSAYALFDCSENDDHQLLRFADAKEGDFEFKYTIDGEMIISRGKAAHACEPQKGFNAASALVSLLCAQFGPSELGSVCGFINSKISTETDGRSLEIKMSDDVSGELTVNLGRVRISENGASAELDIRYPATVNGSTVAWRVRREAEKEGLKMRVINHNHPLNISDDSRIMKLLSHAYGEIVGNPPRLYSTGGGTYARRLGENSAAFGPVFEDDDCRMHNCDESLDEEKFFLHAQICLQAMYEMYTEKI